MKEDRPLRKKINRSLIIGLIMVGMVVFLAVAGPLIAPKDPMQVNYALSANGKIHSPPYAPLEVKGYILGTDNYGRDMLSRILAGIRPTLFTVALVAFIRLMVALIIGLAAGWTSNMKSGKLDSLISIAVSLPVLIVALITISAIGSQKGLWVFLIGLTVTGWADTSHLVSQKTKEVKSQTYIDISRSLGASTPRILITHVVPQILPMIWMMMAYEVSSTLLVLAELGFLGYYVGGGVLIPVDDWKNINVIGLPELGQILSTSLKNLTAPLVLVVTGTVIFFIILGFNLLGNGLRQDLELTQVRSNLRIPLLSRIYEWVQWELFSEIRAWLKKRVVLGILIGMVLFLAGGSIWWFVRTHADEQTALRMSASGNQTWESERGNAQGTRFVPFFGPRESNVLWKQKPADKFIGGPVVAENGTVYVVGEPGTLFSYHPDGSLAWDIPLNIPPVGTPALSAQGNILIADDKGGLSSYSPEGKLLWQFAPTSGRMATSGPIVGKNGNAYYTRLDTVQAVTSSGIPLWNTYVSDTVLDNIEPRLSPQEDILLINKAVVLVSSGSRLTTDVFTNSDQVNMYSDPFFFVGADGNLYFRTGHAAIQWKFVNGGYSIGKTFILDVRDPQALYPSEAGVNGHGLLWFFYPYLEDVAQVIWIDTITGTVQSKGYIPSFDAQIIGNDAEDIMYLCEIQGAPACYGLKPGDEKYSWEVHMPQGQASSDISGVQIWGALAPGRLYVTTQDGYLYALGDAQAPLN